MAKDIIRIGAWRVPGIEDIREWLVPCEDQQTVFISRQCVCHRYAFHGVPAGSADVIIDRRILSHIDDADPMVVALARKAGKYDGSLRDRWMVRRMYRSAASKLPEAEVVLSVRGTDSVRVMVIGGDKVLASREYAKLPVLDDSYDQWRCVKRNWTRYFRHLEWEEVEARRDRFIPVAIDGRNTISEANIRASKFLAGVSYELGWHRVAREAARRKGIPLWVHADFSELEKLADHLERVQDRLEGIR